jgi:energy-coupling factor transport system substrate-specific component
MWRYRRSGFIVVATAGVLGGVVQGVLEVLYWYPGADTLFSTVYISSSTLSGAILGAGSAYLLVRVLAKTGILTAFGR